MPKEITITISKDGQKVTSDAKGFVGGSCMDFMKPIISALGETEDITRKPEFYQTENAGVKIGN